MATQALTATNNGNTLRRFLNVFSLGVVITVNALANILPINGVTTGDLSDIYPSLFTPAGYVFSIWGLIYTLLAIFVVYQARDNQKDNPRLEKLGYAFIISSVFNSLWIFAWHYQMIALSLICMLGILVSLIVAYERLEIGRNSVSTIEKFTVNLPFSVYLGWITVATVANVTVLLIDLGITGGSAAALWTIIAIIAALLVVLTVLFRRGDVPYTLVLVWASIGIAVRQWGLVPSVAVTGLIVAIALVIMIVLRLSQSRAKLLA